MNVNMNTSNLQANQVQSNVVQNNNQFKDADKTPFLNLLKLLSTDNKIIETTEVMDEKMMGLFLGNAQSLVNSTNATICTDDGLSLFKGLNEEEQESTKEKANENIISMLDVFNYVNVLMKNAEGELAGKSNDVVKNDYGKSIKNTLSCLNSNEPQKQNDLLKSNKLDIGNREHQITEIPIKENQSKIGSLVEKLESQVQTDKSKFKEKINYQGELIANNKPTLERDNKIIEISDESSQIKSSVLTQVKDKIVIMASEQTQGTKHVTMELHPDNMGKVDIKMTFEDNKITIEIKALNEETQKLLTSNAGELSKALSKGGEGTVNVTVKPNEAQHGQNPLDYDSQNNQDGRQKNKNYYYYNNDSEDSEEDSVFSQIINLRNLKLNNAV
ncbi:MAG: flagellar hook-length control protein FliK [Sedimentibacter sp.]